MEELKKKVCKGLYECNDTNGACACCPYRDCRGSGCKETLLFDVFTLFNEEIIENLP